MKRGAVLVLSLFLFLLLSVSLISAADNATEQTKVNKAYSCLQNKTSGKCAQLTSEEKIFSALATGNCKADLTSDSKFKTDAKYTAQAILAMKGNADAESWLVSKNTTPTELAWYLEIESSSATGCTINYGSSSYNINIGDDKKIDSNAGSCLVLAQDNYWLRISPSCYNEEFSVSCDQGFLTTTLFKKTTGSTVHVSEKTSSASAGGTTKEKVNSYCSEDSGFCNYEATLWAALALDSRGKDASGYLPYLITLADENQKYLPAAFLYAITANTGYKTEVLGKQKSNSWWMESGDKFYDTALALYPLQKETVTEKTNAKTWLLDSQDTDGCWEANTRNTAFILASVWPKTITGGGVTQLPDCETASHYCVSSSACTAAGGEILSEFDCLGSLQKCCTKPQIIETCAEQDGEKCSSNKRCIGGTEVSASDVGSTGICCAGGYCSSSTAEESTCGLNNGICRAGGCGDNEQVSSYTCDSSGDSCCIPQTTGKSYLWIWILIGLIVVVLIGIIFRNRLRMLLLRMRSGRGRPGPSTHPMHHGPPGYPPSGYQRPMMRMPERRIMLPTTRQITRPLAKVKTGAEKELDEVLKKLKEMGK